MTNTVFPPPLLQRVIAQEAPGGAPAALELVLPSVTVPGEPFALKVAVWDDAGYPSLECGEVLNIRMPASRQGTVQVHFQAGQPAVAEVPGLVLDEPGFHRAEATWHGRSWHSHPTRCMHDPPYRIYWGDPHVHTVLSNCHADLCRSLNFCFAAARYVTALDWTAAADHVSNGRCDFDKWKEQTAAANAHDDPPVFATLPAYEASFKGGAGGDNNVYMTRFPDRFIEAYDSGTVMTAVAGLRDELTNGEFMIVPHHTTRKGKHGEISDEIYPGPEVRPVMEIYSKWGASEYRGNPDPLDEAHPGPSYAVDLLERGLTLGFIGGTDTHATMPAGFGVEPFHIARPPGLTAVRAPALSRESVFHAFQRRACYAAALDRIYLDMQIDDDSTEHTRIRTDPTAPREIRVTAAARSTIRAMDVVRNGRTVFTHQPDHWHGTLQWRDEDDLRTVSLPSKHIGPFVYYYARITCESGARAWASPIFLTEVD